MKTIVCWLKSQHKSRWVDLSSGQAIVIIALAAMGLFAMMGLAIDGGRLLLLKRDTQNATDAAAIAAARALCTGREPAPFAIAAAEENGFENNDTSSIEVYAPPISPGFAIEDECKGCFVEVVLKSGIQPSFIGLVYQGNLETTSRAIGVCSPDLNAGVVRADHIRAVWAMSETCSPNPVDINGNSMYIEGGMHSNGYMKVMPGGAGGVFVGPTSHSKGWEVQTNSHSEFRAGLEVNDFFTETLTGTCLSACFSEEELVGCGCWGEEELYPATNPYLTPPVDEYPVSYKISDYNDPTATDLDGNDTPAKIAAAAGEYYEYGCSGPAKGFYDWVNAEHMNGTQMDNGIYYADCDIKINHMDDITGNVTIVSTGYIEVHGGNQHWEPYTQDLLLFSNANKGCNDAIHFSGSTNTWNGNVFAPRGRIQLSASANDTEMHGCLIGNAVKISGSSLTILCDPGEDTVVIEPAIWLGK